METCSGHSNCHSVRRPCNQHYRSHGREKGDRAEQCQSGSCNVAEEVFSSIRTIRSLEAEGKLSAKYNGSLQQATAIAWSRLPIVGTQVGSYMFALYGAYALAFWYGMHLYAKHETKSSGAVITALFSIMIGVNAFSELATYLSAFSKVRSAGMELIKIVDSIPHETISPQWPGEEKTEVEGKQFDLFQQGICLKDISFHYPTRPETQALKEFSLTIRAGKTTALVGPSGSGKSTIVGLLLGWYEVSSGELTFGDTRMENLHVQRVRANIGLVQQSYLFTGTVFQNIAYGLAASPFEDLSDDVKREMVVGACKLSNAHDFIMRLPEGYDTSVGNRGTSLSGGQKQRLAIARAIVKNPPILILDEATSALDTRSEAVVQQALEKAGSNRTTLSIAHRLTTIKSADQIVVMRNGSIVEIGTHQSLRGLENSIYKRLWEAQEIKSLRASGNVYSNDEYHDGMSRLSAQEPLIKPKTPEEMDRPSIDEEAQTKPRIGPLTCIISIFVSQKKYWWAYLLLITGSAVGGALFPMQAYLYAKLITTFQLTGAALVSRSNFWAMIWFIVALVVAIAYFVIGGIGTALGETIAQYYRSRYFASFAAMPVSYFDSETNSPGALLSRLSADPDTVNSLAGSNLAVLITVLVSLVSTVALALAVGWKLALVVIFGSLPFIFGAGVIHERMENGFEEKAGKVFEASISFAAECVGAVWTVSALNMEALVERRFGALLTIQCKSSARYAAVAMIWFALSESIELLCMALAFWYGGHLMSFHEYSTTQFFIVFVAIIFGSQSTGQFFAHSSDLSKGLTSVRAILSQSATLHEPSSKQSLPPLNELDPKVPLIEFRNTSFSCPTRPFVLVLQNLNMKIYAGQFVALVGPSGCGKSTVIQLLERFYDNCRGDILIGGISVKDLEDSDVRKLFSLVSQEPTLYFGSIRYNVSLSVSDILSSEKLDRVLEQAQLSEFVASLPEGLDTEVELRGTALSGGQKQRVAIARALARDSPVLLLDEATSALDGESERKIQSAMVGDWEGRVSGAKSTGKIVVAVAHRLSTVQHADCIFVFNAGEVVEAGGNVELMERRGVYWGMCKAQTGLDG
ncbi:P-loop containing nucleoside triphosphate hydrolase protein [Aulographum hederae CBS 113979]|uniref:P-loop containing nucleoside triphosphate hydrolase protein n=1 Tax=Aulographum hederae CBS 113979 TaxID=1176131 RepID=A0A6G1HBI0_9PEZI|nr:P-loop containing nucleoside triphosphate hydrolase protein [Aulographum hederae CBS 113979]